MARVQWKLQRTKDGNFRALCCVPIDKKHATRERAATLGYDWGALTKAAQKATSKISKVAAKAASSTPAGALLRATSMVAKLAQNPVLQAVLPPGTGAALKATLLVSSAVQAGKGREVLSKLKGPGAKRLAAVLVRMQPAAPATSPATSAEVTPSEAAAETAVDEAALPTEAAELLE